jgi:hypothetical protein
VWVLAQGVLILFLLSGCGKPKGVAQDQSPEAKHLLNAADLCNEYKSATNKQPTNIDEVKEWAVKAGKATDEDFVSPRDKESYGIAFNPMGGVLVYEQKGKGGKRYIMQMNRVFEEPSEKVDGMLEQFKGVSEHMGGGGKRTIKKGGK